MDKKERLWELISVKLTREITAEESAELTRMIVDNPDLETLMRSLEALWHPTACPPGHYPGQPKKINNDPA